MVINFPLIPLSWLLISYIIPNTLLARYFKTPHFGPTELIFLAQFPGSLLRGGMFVAACVMPQRGKRRQMTDVPKYAPRWYMISSHIMFYGVFLGFGGVWVALFLILLAMLPFVG